MSSRNALRRFFGVLTLLGLVLAVGQLVVFHHHFSFNMDQLLTPLEESKTRQLGPTRDATTEKPSVKVLSDGTFNGLDLQYKDEPLVSHVHCVGENYREDAWIRRSCEFRNLCFDIEENEYVLIRSPGESALNKAIQKTNHSFADTSTSTMTRSHVAIGGINPKWTSREHGFQLMKWFPKVIESQNLTGGYYALPPNVVWIPFHSLAGFNPGHLVWDDFLPIYTLLSMFSHLDKQLFMMRYVVEPRLWATCDIREENVKRCQDMFQKFLPLVGVDPSTFSSNRDFVLKTSDSAAPRSKYVCSRYGVAGIGLLTDHGMKLHGWHRDDYKTTHNHGRGGLFQQFRNFAVNNLGIPFKPVTPDPPYKITFSINSSKGGRRRHDMKKQMDAVRDAFGDMAVVQSYTLSSLSLEEQVRITAESTVYVTVCGGGAVTATFLPKGSSLILYFDEQGGVEQGQKTRAPARLDWDIFNNAAHIRTHWLPTVTMSEPNDIAALVELIRYELETIKSNQESTQ